MKRQLDSLWQPFRRPVMRTILRTSIFSVVVALLLAGTVFVAVSYPKAPWNVLKALIVPAVIAVLGTGGGAWFTRERAREIALQAYPEKMSELMTDKQIHREHRRYADTRVTARARTLAMLSQLDGKRKRTVLLFLREARLINRQWHVRDGRKIYPRIVGLRNADLSNARLRGIQLISTDRKEAVSLEEAILRGADLRCADLEGADMRGADLRSADMRGACLRGVNLDDTGETERPADLRGTDLRKTEGLDENLLSKAIGDRTTKLPIDLKSFDSWCKPAEERPCGQRRVRSSSTTDTEAE